MKKSLYTYLFSKNKQSYLYNSQTSLLIVISKSLHEKLYNEDFDAIRKDVLEELKKNKIVIEDEHLYDDYHFSRLKYLSSIGNDETLNLVLAPTTGCNFACPYCFEGEKVDRRMSYSVVNDLLSFINSFQNAEKVNIAWYGGEPLLAFDIMKTIVERIKNECKIEIASHSIVTNGYLINNSVIDFMKKNPFKKIQITFDGIKENHNKTRCLKGNQQPTYDKIMSNVDRLISEMSDKTIISLRININKDNEGDFTEMYKLIKSKYPNNSNVVVYPGFIRESNKDCSIMCYKSIYGKSRYDFYKNIAEKGLNVDFYPPKLHKGCMACRNNSLIIGPEGEIYKCWNDFNDPKKIVGYIRDREMTNPTIVSRYAHDTTIYNDPKCKECKLFPICDGGCAWLRYQNIFEGKKYDVCTFLSDDHILEECLLMKSVADKKNAIKAV